MRFLYKITNLKNNKVYIGQSYSEIERWRQHKYAARSKPKQYIDSAIKKHGIVNFTYEVIAVTLSKQDADYVEIELIKQYDSRNRKYGYNISAGGEEIWNKGLPKEKHPMYGKKHTKESRQKMSDSLSGINHPLYGKSHKPETILKMSLIKTGKIFKESHKANIAKSKGGINHPLYGKTHSEKTKQKMRNSQLGKKHTEESKQKMSKSKTGTKHSEEVKKNISLSMRGENGPGAKLSNIQRLEIIEKRKNGIKIKILMEEYNVSKMTIIRVSKNIFNIK